jgi:hypothetical protein
MNGKKKINKEATIKNILKKAEGHITDKDAFNKLMQDEDELESSAELWDAEIVYE